MRRLQVGILAALMAMTIEGRAMASPVAAQDEVAPLTVFAITYRPGPQWRPGAPMREQGLLDHFYYVKSLDDAGRVGVAGPLGEDGGLILLRAESQAEAEAVMQADPAVTAGLFVGEVRPFVPRFAGSPLQAVAP